MSDWRPTISLNNLKARAHALNQIRKFFAQHNVLEVETPLVCAHTVTEPNIDSFAIDRFSGERYLQTSPEYAMKRLLASGAPDVYQICKSFRQGEQGQYHNPEFTIIEWYRKEFTLVQMMEETVELINEIAGKRLSLSVRYLSYDDFFAEALGTPFSELSSIDIEQLAKNNGLQVNASVSLEQMIDFLFSYLVNAHMKKNTLTCLYHYPAKQAALAKLNEDDHSVAERFEVFFGELELANGYVELTDAEVQAQRFKQDQQLRHRDGKNNIDIDVRLIEALKHGLPSCAGVALGFDRLLMLALGEDNIEKVMSFTWVNA